MGTHLRWVNGLAVLADCLTKANERKVFLQFLATAQAWRLVFDKFVAGKKLRKKELEAAARRQESLFLQCLSELAEQNRWPNPVESRSMGDE